MSGKILSSLPPLTITDPSTLELLESLRDRFEASGRKMTLEETVRHAALTIELLSQVNEGAGGFNLNAAIERPVLAAGERGLVLPPAKRPLHS